MDAEARGWPHGRPGPTALAAGPDDGGTWPRSTPRARPDRETWLPPPQASTASGAGGKMCYKQLRSDLNTPPAQRGILGFIN